MSFWWGGRRSREPSRSERLLGSMGSSDGSGSPCPEALDALDHAPADLLEEVLVPERCHRQQPGDLEAGAVGPHEEEHPPVALSPAVAAAEPDFVRADRFS